MASSISTVVVGAGYAGLAASHYLTLAGIEHVVIERGRVGETWRSQRWDTFALNTNNRVSALPGEPYKGPNPDGFTLRDSLVQDFQRYAASRRLPIRTGTEVTSLEPGARSGRFRVHTRGSDGASESIDAENLVAASGFQNKLVMPEAGASLPPGILQLHVAGYRNPARLPDGAVLVIGGAQSGCQVVEDLLEHRRRVFLSVSRVARVPRRYRGRDIIDWMIDTGFWDVRLKDLEDPKQQFARQPQVSGVGPRGHTVSLQQLARAGTTLLGCLVSVSGATAFFDGGVPACVQFADERSAFFKRMIDTHIERNGLSAPPPEDDPTDAPDDGSTAAGSPRQLDLKNEGIGSVIWCTGFTGAFNWVHMPAFDAAGRPLHERGVSSVPGLYFLGAPWLHKRKSGVLYGMTEDAEFIVRHIEERRRLAGRP